MAQIGTIKVETAGGPVELPVYELGDSGSNRVEAFRVQTASGPGFVPLTDVSAADRPYLRVQTGNGVKAFDTSASGIPDSVVAQFDAQTLSGLSDGDVVSSRVDQSDGGYDLTNGSGTYRVSGLNGYPTVDYNGSSDGHDAATGLSVTDKFVVFAVIDPDFGTSPSSNQMLCADDSENRGLQYNNTSGWQIFLSGGSFTASVGSIGNLITCVVDGSNSVIRQDGSQVGSGSSSGTLDVGAIGYFPNNGARNFDGDIPFVEIHNGSVSNGLQTREQQIADMWGLTI